MPRSTLRRAVYSSLRSSEGATTSCWGAACTVPLVGPVPWATPLRKTKPQTSAANARKRLLAIIRSTHDPGEAQNSERFPKSHLQAAPLPKGWKALEAKVGMASNIRRGPVLRIDGGRDQRAKAAATLERAGLDSVDGPYCRPKRTRQHVSHSGPFNLAALDRRPGQLRSARKAVAVQQVGGLHHQYLRLAGREISRGLTSSGFLVVRANWGCRTRRGILAP